MGFSSRIILILASLFLLGAKQPPASHSMAPHPAPPVEAHPTPASSSGPLKDDDRYPLPNEKMPGDCLNVGKAYNKKKHACAPPNKAFCAGHQMGFNGTECVKVAPKPQKKHK